MIARLAKSKEADVRVLCHETWIIIFLSSPAPMQFIKILIAAGDILNDKIFALRYDPSSKAVNCTVTKYNERLQILLEVCFRSLFEPRRKANGTGKYCRDFYSPHHPVQLDKI